jgi:hypothetical protein
MSNPLPGTGNFRSSHKNGAKSKLGKFFLKRFPMVLDFRSPRISIGNFENALDEVSRVKSGTHEALIGLKIGADSPPDFRIAG